MKRMMDRARALFSSRDRDGEAHIHIADPVKRAVLEEAEQIRQSAEIIQARVEVMRRSILDADNEQQ
jgi:hypothetical protein